MVAQFSPSVNPILVNIAHQINEPRATNPENFQMFNLKSPAGNDMNVLIMGVNLPKKTDQAPNFLYHLSAFSNSLFVLNFPSSFVPM